MLVTPEVVTPAVLALEPVAESARSPRQVGGRQHGGSRVQEVGPVVAAPTAQAERPAATAGERATLTAVELEYGAGFVDVLLHTGGEPAYRTFWLDDPPRYVVDLSDCVMWASSTRVAVDQGEDRGGIGRLPGRFVRVAQFRGGADPVTRVVIDGAVAEDVEPIEDAVGLRLRLRGGAR